MKQILATAIFLVTLFLAGCGGEKYGAGVDHDAQKVQVKDVFLQPQLIGQKVQLEGNIVTQCQSNGCWFFLHDGSGQIYIDLAKNQFTLPSLPGRQVSVSGVVSREKQSLYLVADGVEVK
ncbi:Predicted protein YdeI with OB-fold, BOF family [Malonomonas rubra DSM 5091]|uniref:Uncharacterized protein n=1 Tax=Malonomonas rubra DSM 5091 TaxID=1122189 RepID=A0A1M6GI68_MALRU|nr:hypothetical protein [Malonomonas rubra]SHJ09591.1 Predicted protein YdeI with OB-fold, BOF family [Malonomonas rubra DSM 5091]